MKSLKKFSILFLLFFNATLYCQYSWGSLIYHYQTGSIPPPHFYQYDLTLYADGTSTLVYYPGYSNDTTWVYNFSIGSEDIKILNDSITGSKLLSEPITSMPEHKHPIGGSMQNVTIFMVQEPGVDRMPQSIASPFFPIPQYQDGLKNLYAEIKSLIPQSVWDEISKRKEEYMNNYKK